MPQRTYRLVLSDSYVQQLYDDETDQTKHATVVHNEVYGYGANIDFVNYFNDKVDYATEYCNVVEVWSANHKKTTKYANAHSVVYVVDPDDHDPNSSNELIEVVWPFDNDFDENEKNAILEYIESDLR